MESNINIGTDRPSQVVEWVLELGKSVARAEDVFTQMQGRLTAITRTPIEEKENPSPYPAEVAQELVSLAAEIRQHVWTLERVTDQYENLMTLIEIKKNCQKIYLTG